MRIFITACGTRGDVQPALALGLALNQNGHEVDFAGTPEDADWIRSYNLNFHPVGDSIQAFMQKHPDLQNPVNALRLLHFLRQHADRLFRELPPIMNGSDLAVAYFVNHAAHTVAEYLKLPSYALATFPQMIPSPHYPPVVFKNHNLPQWLNRSAWWITKKMNNLAFLGSINRHRRQWGLLEVNCHWDHALGARTILATDALLSPMPGDIRQSFWQVGHLPLSHIEALDPDIEAFLNTGPPAVYVGFGSMSGNEKKTFATIMEAVKTLGLKLILAKGWSDRVGIEAPSDVLIVDSAPHTKLFPRLATVVHHGGSGTTATAARAGVPQIIVPHLMDQYYWGRQIQKLGLGPAPIPRHRLTARKLTQAIKECLEHTSYCEMARRTARELNSIDTLDRTVKLLESEYSAIR